MKIPIFDINGNPTNRKVYLDSSIFNVKLHKHIVYLEIKRYLSAQRQGKHKTKERSELSGSTRKIHKQKGTGQSRKGDINNPIFRGGSRIFGPKPKQYNYKLNKSAKILAKKSILSQKFKENSLKVIEDFLFEIPSTKKIINILRAFNAENKRTLFILSEPNKSFYLSSRNLITKKVITINELNNYDLFNSSILFFFESSIKLIQKNINSR
jgi:large subunit ribosomal protein L4